MVGTVSGTLEPRQPRQFGVVGFQARPRRGRPISLMRCSIDSACDDQDKQGLDVALDVVFRDGAPLPVRAEDVACRDLRRVLTWFLPGSTSPGVLCVAAKALAMARPEDRIKATGGTVAHFCKAVGSQRL